MEAVSSFERSIWCVLAVMILVLQYRLWVGEDSLVHAWLLQDQIAAQQQKNALVSERNARLEAEVTDLKTARDAIEELGRSNLGLIRPGETFFLVTNSH